MGGSGRGGSVVEEKDIDGEEEERHGPDRVGGSGTSERFKDRREPEQSEVDEEGGFGG